MPSRRIGIALAGLLTALPLVLLHAQSRVADTIFTGQFLTLDDSHPHAEAMAVYKGRIMALGSPSELEALADKNTRRITFSGVAVPGLEDAHIHVSGIGAELERLNLRGLTKAQILKKVAQAVRSSTPGAWIRGEGWDQGFWHPAIFPTAQDLDSVSGGHPVVLNRIDGHSTWVNSKVLALAKISRDTRDPEGGQILRNAAGEPTGMLVDNAQELIRAVIPRPSHADVERQIRAALQQFTRWGLTSVQDAAVDLDTIAIYKNLLQRGELPVRVYVMAEGEQARKHYLATGPELDLGDGMLAVRSFKLFADGALGSRGAELTEPYADAHGEHGLELIKDADLDRIIRAARQKGFQVNTHAIGDRAVRRVLDAYQRAGVTAQERFRVEHASMISDKDLPRFVQLGVIASIQPVFVGEYSRWAEDRVGPSRVHWVLRTRDLLKAGALVAAGTDYPASDSGSPIDNLYCAVTRRGADGAPAGGWYSDQRVDVDQALRMMTVGAAYAAFQEKDLGELSVGRYADFTVLSANPYQVPSDALKKLSVRLTVVAGRATFDAGSHQTASRQ
ncbi:MAG TPA: amidohydrolase [Terriglobales bacterium]|nr:amidohydrolase [Terriglobales bacterium]